MTQNLSQIIASTKNGKLRIRLLAVSHFIDRQSKTQISKCLKVSRTSVNKWVKAYLDQGLRVYMEKSIQATIKALVKCNYGNLKIS